MATKNISEYQEEFCGLGGGTTGKGSGGEKGGPTVFPVCRKSYDIQPVGGRMQKKYRDALLTKIASPNAADLSPNATSYQMDIDPNIGTSRGRNTFPMPNCSGSMAVPDVHKLRYMHNDYMTRDDWYDHGTVAEQNKQNLQQSGESQNMTQEATANAVEEPAQPVAAN
ncbi:unnamed protein product [Dimorphilus gyrociliatus]|uniref:Uncharacterized protein n=1 Tax=Dimorphilus gyrociliatus TaxID=2664684 RepID=A0A7I8VNG6_9ANNE|nr:unnamed protein product [Dimorphilus gyrociliatus]